MVCRRCRDHLGNVGVGYWQVDLRNPIRGQSLQKEVPEILSVQSILSRSGWFTKVSPLFVNLYFCLGLFGDVGSVISTRFSAIAGFMYELSSVGRCFRFKAFKMYFIDIGLTRMFNSFCTCSVTCSVTCSAAGRQIVTLKSPSCSNRGFFRPCCRHSFTISPVPVPAFSMKPERCRGSAINGLFGSDLWGL